ncbi:MAG: 4-hydroxybenzoate octaprenyltransferase [Alphaproteobacteria bacterium]|jgi:4-hydroxybenzoate polyprenyl transferase|nr:4-hydroxybenzoate octaprenyltransferase [Alphaproteobacteria bacterium]
MNLAKLLSYIKLTRLNSLFGAFLLLLPSYWSLALNNYNERTFVLICFYILFFFGAMLARGFGCIINDFIDIKIDSQVSRTKNRPLASGEVSKKEALILLLVLGCVLLIVLILLNLIRYNLQATFLAFASVILVVVYPFFKRFFSAPQLVLGLTFNWGIFLADSLLNFKISQASIFLYIASVVWTIAYDTIYAYQDYEDDKKLGVKSTAQILGENPYKFLKIMYIIFTMIVLGIGNMKDYSLLFFIVVIIAYLFVYIKLKKLDYKNTVACGKFFKHNVYFAVIIWLAFLIGNYNF